MLRCTTAVLVDMDKVNTISFYTGPPKKRNRRAIYTTDGKGFAKSMQAIVRPTLSPARRLVPLIRQIQSLPRRSPDGGGGGTSMSTCPPTG